MLSKILHGLIIILSFCHLMSENFNNKNHQSRYLLLVSRIIDKLDNAKLSVGKITKNHANPLFSEDKPWEKRFDNLYGNVIYDDKGSKFLISSLAL